MQDRLRTTIAEYTPADWNGKNESGITPIGDLVLVLPFQVEEKTAGGIIKPQNTTHVESMASEFGTIVAVGDGAFTWNVDRTREFSGQKPHPGDHISFKRYAYVQVPGADGRTYWVMSDHVISSIIDRKPKAKTAKAA